MPVRYALLLLLIPAIAAAAPPGADAITGTYATTGSDLMIQRLSPDRIKFQILAVFRQNVGELTAEAPLHGNTARYVDAENDCRMTITFAPKQAVVTQDGVCGMGFNVTGAGTYRQIKRTAPTFERF